MNSNAAVILTNDGVVVVDSHSKPSAAQALYKEIQAVSKKPVKKIINTHFHWDHWQGNEVYAQANPSLEIIASERVAYFDGTNWTSFAEMMGLPSNKVT